MIIKRKPEDLANYLEDTSNIKGEASLLYLPKDKGEVSASIEQCCRKKIPFTVSSGRTGTTGGCVPGGGAIISLENLNKIIDIDKERQLIRLEAGITLEELNKEINKFNLALRASPTESLAFIGGAISTCASGVRGFGYGSIRRYIEELEVILTTGELITIRRGDIFSQSKGFDFEYKSRRFKFNIPSYQMPKVKSQAGYFIKPNMDLIDLFIGSEGTLGVITSCVLNLQKIPFRLFDGLLFFSNESDALIFVDKIKALQRERLLFAASLEFFDKNSLDMLRQQYSFVPNFEAAVYFEQEAEDQKSYNSLINKWQVLMEESGADIDKSIFADTSRQREIIFEFRHKLPQMINEFLRQNKQTKAATDISIPENNFSKMHAFYNECAQKAKIRYVNFGHIGESHLHFNFLPQNDSQAHRARGYIADFCKRAVALGGTVSAEHGIGKIKKPYLKIMYTESQIEQMAGVKKYFDPPCLLGLDNIFKKEILFNLG
ncbi:MAG: FAD-binding oxidoreductase [Omnitrophica bacterium]|nr:FAD-binding oxidoreductase [Candidatus Omnitrophota bacterium]